MHKIPSFSCRPTVSTSLIDGCASLTFWAHLRVRDVLVHINPVRHVVRSSKMLVMLRCKMVVWWKRSTALRWKRFQFINYTKLGDYALCLTRRTESAALMLNRIWVFWPLNWILQILRCEANRWIMVLVCMCETHGASHLFNQLARRGPSTVDASQYVVLHTPELIAPLGP